jgi:hypothetical protein
MEGLLNLNELAKWHVMYTSAKCRGDTKAAELYATQTIREAGVEVRRTIEVRVTEERRAA